MINLDYTKIYNDALYLVQINGAEYRLIPGKPLPDGIRSVVQSSFTFLTAYNPQSKMHNENDNISLNQRLRLDLIESGFNLYHGRGSDHDGLWVEFSFFVCDISRSEACHFARKYDQKAFLFWEADKDMIEVVFS